MKEQVNQENVKPANERSESVKSYEKSASKTAGGYNTTLENIFNSGLISKEDIIRLDAEVQNEILERIKINKKNSEDLANSPNGMTARSSFSKEEILLSNKKFIVAGNWGAEHSSEEQLLKQIESDLNLTLNIETYESKQGDAKVQETLKGKINGQEVVLTRKIDEDDKNDMSADEHAEYSGTLNGKELPKEEVKKLFLEHIDLQKIRLNKVENLYDKRAEEKKQKEKEEKDQKQMNAVKGDLDKIYDAENK